MASRRQPTRIVIGIAAGLATAAVVAVPLQAVQAQAAPESATPSRVVALGFVEVGNAGNAADPATGFGTVAEDFRMSRNAVTIGQYVKFLNSVARKADKRGLYNPKMATDLTVAGIRQTRKGGHFHYSVIDPRGAVQTPAATGANRPITYVSWFDAARFVNWLSNGQPHGRQNNLTTERGAYDLLQPAAREGYAVPLSATNPNTGEPPTHRIPTENQWYKAAYYSPDLNAGSGGYYPFATQSTSPPGNSLDDTPAQANYTWAGVITITRAMALDLNQNFLTDVGAFTGAPGPFGTFDMNGNVWEWNDANGAASGVRILRGGGWTSYYTYLQSTYRLGSAPSASSSNAGMRLASRLSPEASPDYELVTVGDPGNDQDLTGYGRVDDTFSIGRYEVTIGQYADFLDAVARDDSYGLYDPNMASMKNSAGIARTGSPGSYAYAPMDNLGDSADRPITYVSWFDVARFANWMANGRPTGAQGPTTTENGTYPVNGATRGSAVARNEVNPNTGSAPTFALPTENEWYKAAYYSPDITSGSGGYYLYATQSNTGPGNTIGSAPNQVNYIDDFSGSNAYSITQTPAFTMDQNYLTDVGYFRQSPSHYGAFDLNGNVYAWNDLDGTQSVVRGLRGGFWFAGPPSIQSTTFAQAGVSREANDTGIRVVRCRSRATFESPACDTRAVAP